MINATIYRAAAEPRGRILCIHGWMGGGDSWTAMNLSNLGFDVLIFDLRGHGQSEGKVLEASRENYLEDCAEAYDLLAMESKATKAYVYGVSYGGYLACCLLNDRYFDGIAVRVPANFTRDGISHPLLALEECDQSEPVVHTQANRGLRDFGGSGLIVVSGEDGIIHPNVSHGYERIVEDLDKVNFVCMEGADHNLDEVESPYYEGLLLDWFQGLDADHVAVLDYLNQSPE